MSTIKNVDDTGVDGPPTAEGPPKGVRTMSIVRWVLVAIAGLVAVGSILSYAGVHIGGAKSESSAQLYYCPMHPSVVQDHPGECPICSMTLVPKVAGSAARPAAGADGSTAAEPKPAVPGLAAVDLSPASARSAA